MSTFMIGGLHPQILRVLLSIGGLAMLSLKDTIFRFCHSRFFLRFWQIVQCLLLSTSHPHVVLVAISLWPPKS